MGAAQNISTDLLTTSDWNPGIPAPDQIQPWMYSLASGGCRKMGSSSKSDQHPTSGGEIKVTHADAETLASALP